MVKIREPQFFDTALSLYLTLLVNNSCQYLAEKFYLEADKETILSAHAVCICDDDNDLEMALACQHAYIPEVTSQSMADVISANADHFTKTCGDGEGHKGTTASETALSLVLGRFAGDTQEEDNEEEKEEAQA